MRVPGVTALVGGVAGGAVQMLQAGVQGVTTAADAVQTLTGPVLDSVSQSTARLLGISRPTLYELMEKLRIRKKASDDEAEQVGNEAQLA